MRPVSSADELALAAKMVIILRKIRKSNKTEPRKGALVINSKIED